MSTAVENPPPAPEATTSPRTALLAASATGAGILLAAFLGAAYVAQYLVPSSWPYYEVMQVSATGLILAAAIGIVSQVLGRTPPKGTRGGIFLMISLVVSVFLIVRGIGLYFHGNSVGMYITVGVLAGLVFLSFRLLTSPRGERWMQALEDQGWFHTHGYKKTQGLHLRRYTLIGILIIGGSGVYSIVKHQMIGSGHTVLQLPFTNTTEQVPVVPGSVPPASLWDGWQLLANPAKLEAEKKNETGEKLKVEAKKPTSRFLGLPTIGNASIVIPLALAFLTFWVGYRLVNLPTFADFLIATEAEMNKVSWATRKRLTQDTIVVLVTVFIITLFLLMVDLFWGWLLSAKYIEVLPKRQDTKMQQDATGNKPLSW
jgi:preprotein translocase SecE subunit